MNYKKSAIAIYGGSFNPLTNAHCSLAEQVICEFDNIEKVVFVPVGDKYKKNGLIDSKHRVNMLKAVCDDNINFEISLIEIESERTLPTIDTLRLLKKAYNKELYFIIGTDNLKEINSWQSSEEIIKNFKLIVFERGLDDFNEIINTNSLLKKYNKNIFKLNEPIKTTCSSTIIRDKLKNKKSVKYLIPHQVDNYIKNNSLYY